LPKYDQTLIELIKSNEEMMSDLATVRQLQLPDWYIAAGYVRNYIWDCLHEYTSRTPLNDIDVIYFNSNELDEELEKRYERQLEQATGSGLWSVKNQARMHIQNGNDPYNSVEDAISHWPETVTAVGIRLEADDSISLICPYGLEDIFEYRVRRSPLFKDEAYYQSRLNKKAWKKLWPKLQMNGG
jgi:hypothetical protein